MTWVFIKARLKLHYYCEVKVHHTISVHISHVDLGTDTSGGTVESDSKVPRIIVTPNRLDYSTRCEPNIKKHNDHDTFMLFRLLKPKELKQDSTGNLIVIV